MNEYLKTHINTILDTDKLKCSYCENTCDDGE